jgi:large conductance mechanosensitive channel
MPHGEVIMSLASEFKEFAMRGNVIDLAVGVVIGAAFGKVVSSLVGDVIMPPLGLAVGRVNFAELAVRIGTDPAGKPVLFRYGAFLQSIFEFLIIALAIFALLKVINTLKRPPPPTAPTAPPPTKSEQLLTDIRDLLARK